MECNGINKVAKRCNTKYTCKKCDYNTSRKSSYDKHLLSTKHTQSLIGSCNSCNSCNDCVKHICNICSKKYNTQSGLWKHKQKCKEQKNKSYINIEQANTNNNVDNNIFTPKMFYDLLQQNNELTKQVIELSSKPTTTNNNTTNNNNSFNLNFFLNETCKDALNISEFISQLHVGIKDLEETGRLGYADGISKIFINGLKQLEVTQRPVHCSDAKRETIYIKDKNQWEKDDDEKVKLTKAIKSVAHKNIEQIAVWTEAHPEYMNYNSKYSEKYMKLIGEAMPGATYAESDKNYKKIARNITKETIINK
jgi:hypothetical protein